MRLRCILAFLRMFSSQFLQSRRLFTISSSNSSVSLLPLLVTPDTLWNLRPRRCSWVRSLLRILVSIMDPIPRNHFSWPSRARSTMFPKAGRFLLLLFFLPDWLMEIEISRMISFFISLDYFFCGLLFWRFVRYFNSDLLGDLVFLLRVLDVWCVYDYLI